MKIIELKNKIEIQETKMNRNFLIPKLEDSILLNKSGFFYYICGSPGSGKTNLCLSMLNNNYNKVFDKIYLYSPSCHTINSKLKINPERIRKNLSSLGADIDNIEKEYKEGLNEGCVYSTCIIIDDLIADINRRKNDDILKHLVLNRSHMNVSIFILSQKFKELSPIYRINANGIIVFPRKSKLEIDAIIEESNLFFDAKMFRNALIECWETKHSFAYLNLDEGRMYKRFEYEIQVDDDDDDDMEED